MGREQEEVDCVSVEVDLPRRKVEEKVEKFLLRPLEFCGKISRRQNIQE